MTYRVQLLHFIRHMEDHFFRIKKAEKIQNLWKVNVLLLFLSVIIYGFMAYLGIGTNLLSIGAVNQTPLDYELHKFWFVLGRMIYAVLFAAFILFIPSLLYYLLTDVSYRKLMIMQQIVLSALLLERLIWIPMVTLTGLDWYVSPLSFGVIASYLTETSWVIYFFGAISLFQIWIIWFQTRYLITLSQTKKHIVWINVILLNVILWCFVALLSFADSYLISGWFE
ncbi:hypothetical protein D8M04_19740 [Oceanobacillus piezotolerans]|uniref:Yip1 domain-containing protein n=1 Tax=Oceanobacillus piezotolerans TaxID=2448030 RepID=A0A498D120_9BACI|nr:hypothetical protein [Oceanobacillus piezotolerans]RLL39945.1 hypothetical protein D8M04_19740 [Oceanobacillus piezotolerans]